MGARCISLCITTSLGGGKNLLGVRIVKKKEKFTSNLKKGSQRNQFLKKNAGKIVKEERVIEPNMQTC